MASLKRFEGYYQIDQTHGPGVDPHPDLVAKFGYAPTVKAGENYECATHTCSHCGVPVILNPQRTRPRGYCAKCDRYICERCALVWKLTLECRPFQQFLDSLEKRART